MEFENYRDNSAFGYNIELQYANINNRKQIILLSGTYKII